MHRILTISLFLFTLGFFLMPDLAFACIKKQNIPASPKTEKEATVIKSATGHVSFCESGHCKDKCCNKTSHNCQHGNCNSNCGGSTCPSTSGFNFFAGENSSDFINNSWAVSLETNRFFYLNPNYSFGFHSIWQPPKIG